MRAQYGLFCFSNLQGKFIVTPWAPGEANLFVVWCYSTFDGGWEEFGISAPHEQASVGGPAWYLFGHECHLVRG